MQHYRNPIVNQESASDLNPSGIERAFRRYQQDLRNFLLAILRNADDAADALASTYAKLVEHFSEINADSVRPWLFRVAYNEAMLIRRNRRQKKQVDAGDLEHLVVGNAAVWKILAAQTTDAESAAVQRENRDRVREAISRLPEEQVVIVRLRIYEDLKFVEIAERLNIPLGTVLSRMHAALARLRRALDSVNPESGEQ